MGYAVSEALTSRGEWDIHIFDMNLERGKPAADKLGATFHEVNVGNPFAGQSLILEGLPSVEIIPIMLTLICLSR